jgi:hypothetical protein
LDWSVKPAELAFCFNAKPSFPTHAA